MMCKRVKRLTISGPVYTIPDLVVNTLKLIHVDTVYTKPYAAASQIYYCLLPET